MQLECVAKKQCLRRGGVDRDGLVDELGDAGSEQLTSDVSSE